jgi:hypothetical protein
MSSVLVNGSVNTGGKEQARVGCPVVDTVAVTRHYNNAGSRRRCFLCGPCRRFVTDTANRLIHGVEFSQPCGDGFEYIHRSPASRMRRRKGNPVPEGYNWATLFLGDINTGTWSSRLGESRIWDSKIWSRIPRDSDPRMTALARTSNNCKRQTRFLVTESAPHQLTRNCPTAIKIWS